LGFDEGASSRVHNLKDGQVTKWYDLREMKRASLCDEAHEHIEQLERLSILSGLDRNEEWCS
jgi:hypothetical protein